MPWIVGIPQERDPRRSRNRLLEELELLNAQVHTEGRCPGDVTARSREAGNDAQLNWVRSVHHDDRDGCGRSLGAQDGSWIIRDDHVDLQAYEIQREVIEPLDSSLGIPNLEDNVAALDVSQLAQALLKCRLRLCR